MSLCIQHLHIRIQTSEGLYGTRIAFDDGLVILRADNNMGKSTCVQSIIYALGLERMLGPTTKIPLQHVLTDYVQDENKELNVLESEILLEISNRNGQVITIRRSVVGKDDYRLVNVWEGPQLSNSTNTFVQQDYYVRDAGSVTNEAGFHNYLAKFLGWELPIVSRYDGTECPLYLEAIFPLFIVEQKHGWAGIQANLPTFLGIKEMSKRALEFVLELDAAFFVEEKRRLEQEESEFKSQWKGLLKALGNSLRRIKGQVIGLPDAPTAQWPLAIPPQLVIFRNEQWVSIDELLSSEKNVLAQLMSEPIPTSGEDTDSLAEDLEITRKELNDLDVLAGEIFSSIDSERMQIKAIDSRLTALTEDLQRNKDAAKIKSLGSVLSWSVSNHTCPTCQQEITDALLPQSVAKFSMSIEQNIVYIQNQIKIFERQKQKTEQAIIRKESEIASIQNEIMELRSKIRVIKESLIARNNAPSIAAIRERFELERRINEYANITEEFNAILDSLAEVAERWRDLLISKKSIPRDGISIADKEKIDYLEKLLIEQLHEFGFSSINPNSLKLSQINYNLTREGFNLGFDISASDNIRMIWAYLEGLLELSNKFSLRHIDLLIFDEPRQQEAAEIGFANLLRRAARSKERGQQIIFVTSEPRANIERITEGLNPSIISFGGRVIVPLT